MAFVSKLNSTEEARAAETGFVSNLSTASSDKPFVSNLRTSGQPSAITRREQPRSSFGGNFARSARRGSAQSVGLAGQLLKSIGDSTGFAGMVDLGDDLIREAFVEAVVNPARIESLDEAFSSFSNAGTFVIQTLGEQIPNLAVAAISGGIGAYAAKLAIGKAALQGIATKALARGPVLTGTVEAATAKFVTGRAL